MSRFEGRVAIVTGAARNIGRACAERLVADGAQVVVADVDGEALAATASDLGAVAVVADCGVAADVERVFAVCAERFGRLDALVNNAAIVGGAVSHFLEGDEAWWDRVLSANLKSVFLCSQRAARVMAASGRGGVIVSMSSGGATRAHRGMAAYDAAKGGIEALTRAMALDLAPYGVRTAAVVPGLVYRGPELDSPEAVEKASATIPLGRMATPADVAGMVAFLCSDDASHVTGATFTVDGGLLVQQRSPQVETFPVSRFPTVR